MYPSSFDLERSLKTSESFIDSRGLFIEGEYLRWPPAFFKYLDSVSVEVTPPPRHLVFHFVKIGGGGGRFPVEKRMLIPSDNASQTEADLALLQQKLRAKYPNAKITT
jgi:hypothetical protein